MSDMQCPYCGADQEVCHDDGAGYVEDQRHEHTCSECDKTFVFRMALPTYDADGQQETVGIGDAISACVRRPGGRQMYWHAGRVIAFDGDRALIELDRHKGERALLSPKSIRRRTTMPNAELCGAEGVAHERRVKPL